MTPIILFVGRMVERKGVHLIRPLVGKYREWHWVFVGRPDDHNPAEWGYPNLTYYDNASENRLKELYASSDLLIHPSTGEGVTLIVSESLSSGTPVIISQESLYEVEEKDRSLFFPVEPVTHEIETVLVQALSDRQRLEGLRATCRDFALSRLSWRRMVEQYLTIVTELVDKNKR
jgi:glycosyltransferase involved in cell wall biosynthesis